MNQKVIFNGIEISQSKYDKKSITIFDYLDKIKNRLEKGLSKEDGNAHFTVDVDFASNSFPKYNINANGSTTKKTKEKIANILMRKIDNEYSNMEGSVKVNFLVEDRR